MVVVLSGQDITEHVRAEQELRRLAFFDALTGLPNRAQFESRAARRSHARAAAPARGRAAARRPRQLQARQRLARARRRRPAAAPRRRAAARHRGRARPARAPRRRRVPAAAGRPRRATSAERGRARGGRPARAAARQAVHGRRRRVPRRGEHRHLALPRGRRRRRGAAPARRRRDVPEQGPRARGVDGLRGRHPRPARASVAVARGCDARSPATSSRCTTSRSCGRRAAGCTRWRRCCAGRTPTAGSCTRTRFIPAAEEMGLLDPIGAWVIDALARADRHLARPRACEPRRVVQRLPARAAAARLRGGPAASACAAPASTRRC